MGSRCRMLFLCAFAMVAAGCAADSTAPARNSVNPETVRLSLVPEPSQSYETCREIRVHATAARGNKPVRGVVVNFVPLSGSVFAAAVITNKDGAAANYWNLGSIFQSSSRLIARAIDEDGQRVLDDTLFVERQQHPTRLLDYGLAMFPDPDPTVVRPWLIGRVRLVDACGDPIPWWPLTATYSGPIAPIEPVVQSISTIQFGYPDSSYWGMGVSVHTFPPGVLPGSGFQLIWQVVGVPALTVTQVW